MISEVDLRDWDHVDFTILRSCEKEKTGEYLWWEFYKFQKQVEALRDKQMQSVAALLRKKDA